MLGPDFAPTSSHYSYRRRAPVPEQTYHGHRRDSFVSPDIDELTELRARQRTFDGAYIRTALGNFGYALLILKVFTVEFARIGLLYVILAVLLLLISYRRARRGDIDFADIYRPASPEITMSPLPPTPQSSPPSQTAATPANTLRSEIRASRLSPSPARSVSAGPRIWGRPFRTSGDVVVLMCIVCTVLYAAIFALVMDL